LRSNSKEEQGDRSQESHREGRIREAGEKQATLLKSEGHSGSVGVHEEKVEERKYVFSEASWLQKISRSFSNTYFRSKPSNKETATRYVGFKPGERHLLLRTFSVQPVSSIAKYRREVRASIGVRS